MFFPISYIQNNPTNGLVAWYKFNNNLLDSSNNHNGSLNGGTLHYTPSGKIGTQNSFYFNGSTMISGANALTLPTSKFTVCCWVYSPLSSIYFAIGWGTSTTGIAFFEYNSSWLANIDNSSMGSTAGKQKTNTWQWLALTYNGTSATQYIDNVLVKGPTSISQSITTPTLFYIGESPQQTSFKYVGMLQDVRIYNRVLLASEMLALFNWRGAF